MWTDRTIRGYKAKNKRYRVSDDLGQKGAGKLVLDILPSGAKNFFYQYYHCIDGKSKRTLIKIGTYKSRATEPGITLSQARERAIELSKISNSGDVKSQLQAAEQKKQTAHDRANASMMTLRDVLESYIANKDLKPGTIFDYRRTMKETFPAYLDKPINTVSRNIILKLYEKRSKISVARTNIAMRVFRALYNYQRAVTRQEDGNYLMPENPVSILREARVTKKVPRRKTYIPKEMLADWFTIVLALDDENFTSGTTIRDYLIFVLLTGTRREEARTLKKSDVDLSRGVFTLKDTKNREQVELPMSHYLNELMHKRMEKNNGQYVFSGLSENKPFVSFKRPIAHLRQQLNHPFTIHDLRRTFITVAESMDISIYTLKRLVNHKLSESNDVTAGYVMVDIDRLRSASEKISQYILQQAHLAT